MESETPTQNQTIPTTTPEESQTTSQAGFTTLNISGQDPAPMSGEAEEYHNRSVSGARWFFWIAALSMINSIISVFDGNLSFLAGLGMTQIISGLAGLSEDLGGAVTIVALVFGALIAGVFVALGWFAQKGHTWAFIVGLVVYAFDALIFLMVQDWFPLAFHGFVLFCLVRGLMAQNKWKQLQAAASA